MVLSASCNWAKKLVAEIEANRHDFYLANYANADMVGHTGNLQACVKAIETVDTCLKQLHAAIKKVDGILIITADHGNAEIMVDETGGPHTAHTTDRVPLILVDDQRKGVKLRPGILADIAPTMLDILGLAKPAEMTGTSLIEG